tara:strand:- start:4496 stop:5041 length:546 start_codon:yes stop_codon:yes gene_type:complete
MKLTNQQNELLKFVKLKHGEQIRKYTGEPYFNHTLSVANTVSKYIEGAVEIALCHDLFEDTETDFTQLYNELKRIGYDPPKSYKICTVVKELSDKYTKEDFPFLNRAKRKELEAVRLGKISEIGQSVKYADLIDNSESILKHDPRFAKTYIKEKKRILELMNEGNPELLSKCINIVNKNKS